jgi:hypothetical protein
VVVVVEEEEEEEGNLNLFLQCVERGEGRTYRMNSGLLSWSSRGRVRGFCGRGSGGGGETRFKFWARGMEMGDGTSK